MTVVSTAAPSRQELVSRAASIVPLLREHAAWGDDNRRLHPDVVEAMKEAGLYRMTAPRRYGGYECDIQTQVAVHTEVGRGDGSASWVAAVWGTCIWFAGLFPDEAQDEVFSATDVRVSGIFSPTAVATPRSGGYEVKGNWRFNTGILDAQWDAVAAMRPNEDGTAEPILILIPVSDLQIVDDWDVSGLRGTGSCTSVADGIFVPEHRVVPILPALHEQYLSEANAASALFQSALVPVTIATSAGTPLGVARAALETVAAQPDRPITYTQYVSRFQAPVTHLSIGEAALKVESAKFHAQRAAETVDRKAESGEPWTVEERCLVRADVAWVCRLCHEAVDLLYSASGASSIYRSGSMQRLQRDSLTMTMHAFLLPNTNLELYGRVLCGQEPSTPFI